jgi:hypothetical protein
MAGRGKPRPDAALTVRIDDNALSLVPVPVAPPLDPCALAIKLQDQTTLTPEEREYLVSLIEKDHPSVRQRWVSTRARQQALRVAGQLTGRTPEKRERFAASLEKQILHEASARQRWVGTRAQQQALRVAAFYIVLKGWFPEKQTKYIESVIAKTFQCSIGAVRRDVRFAKKLDGGVWWQIAERDKLIW